MSKHVIFSRNNNGGAISVERINQLAPAVFSHTKAERLSDRYVSLHTSDLLPVFADYGYEPVQAAQRRARTASPEHAHHMIAFAKPLAVTGADADGFRPEVVLYNSHDGTGAVRLFAGAFRFICSNGIIAGEGFASRTYHNKSLLAFEDMLRGTLDNLPKMMERIEHLRTVTLDMDTMEDMAIRCTKARWDMYDQQEKGSYATASTVRDVLQPQRIEDCYSDAWTVFNRIQENVLRGNATIKSITDKGNTMRKARPVNSIKEHVRINAELWDIAESVAA